MSRIAFCAEVAEMVQHKCETCGKRVTWFAGQAPLGWTGERCRRCVVIGGLLA